MNDEVPKIDIEKPVRFNPKTGFIENVPEDTIESNMDDSSDEDIDKEKTAEWENEQAHIESLND